ncbi:aminoglycoside phosphotransferase (APT) family kinase protein [Mesorhizobium soli]|uniref:aminoglycoside phosphotransferase family protein n=1 Tax=Pseudaminobacter soli (ex Li et al. 2025) TaxID=1295366 RepID=UPI002474B5B7|nr:aminoglycoside phosphotransferase family protein [Mesorhizobium soli]MDH6233260.1 aminoglycoside phosphotransferase (APT) family kinase protein [Mesorhizobium soli]
MVQDEQNRAVSITNELVGRLIAKQFPEWSGWPIAAVVPGGWDNRTFRLGDEMSSAAAYVAQVEKEQYWLPKLAPNLPLPISVPVAKGAPGEGYPWQWSVYRWLEGEPATAGGIADLTAFARALAGFLAALHRIDATGGPPAGEDNFHRGGRLAVYDAQIRTALSALADRIDTAAAAEIWAAALASEWLDTPLWVHGDIAAGNLLVRDGALCAVIDFGCLAVGDPACDLVIAWALFSGDSRQAFRQALAFDEDTWRRARGWALWKAAITAAGHDKNQREAEQSLRILADVVAEYRSRSLV